MATMTPVVLLVIFCATMSAISIGRLLRADDRDPLDVGTALVVVGLTALAGLWVALEEEFVGTVGLVLGAGVGTFIVGIGVATIGYYWTEPAGDASLETVEDAEVNCE